MLDKVLRDLRSKLSHSCNVLGKEHRYKNASVLIPLIEFEKDVHVLYQIRSPHIRQGGEVGFPGGMVETIDGGDYEKTAIRETIEELGIEEKKIQTIGYLGTYVTHYDVTIDVYVGVLHIKSLDELNCSEEVADVFTVPIEELLSMDPEIHYIESRIQQTFMTEENNEIIMIDAEALGLPDKYTKPWRTHKRRIFFYRYANQIIWGMTGEITYEFLKVLKVK